MLEMFVPRELCLDRLPVVKLENRVLDNILALACPLKTYRLSHISCPIGSYLSYFGLIDAPASKLYSEILKF